MTKLTFNDLDPEQRIRHIGLLVREHHWLTGESGPFEIRDGRTTVRWDVEACAAVFDLDGVKLTVLSDALDDIALVPS